MSMKDWKTELRTLFQMEDMPILETFIEALLTSQRESLVKEVEGMPAFTCCSDKCMGKVSDEAKKPAYGTNYLEREAVIKKIKQ